MALVITRRKGESLLIGEALVTIVTHSRNRLTLRVDAPDHVKIYRTELIRRPRQIQRPPVNPLEEVGELCEPIESVVEVELEEVPHGMDA